MSESPVSSDSPETSAQIAELKQRIADLELAVRAREDFLAMAAHELRNPLTPILGQVERLNRMVGRNLFSPEQVCGTLGLIEQLIRLFIKRATMLLDVSRMTSGKLKLQCEMFDLTALIRRVVEAHEPAAEHAGSGLLYADQAPLDVLLDPLAVEQILDNILLNALRYGGGQPVTIRSGGNAFHVWMTVEDHGSGIAPADRNRIFEKFEQAVFSPAHGGFGIGLWVVGQLVQAMRGEITVDTALNKGSSFKVTLPRTISQTT
jgi:two-component system OmpR family sensor kinase